MRSQRAKVATFAVLGVLALPWACGNPTVDTGSGDDFTDDTRDAQTRPPPTPPDPDANGADALYTDIDASEGGSSYGLDLGACDTCHCDPSANYCFGGATPRGAIVRLDTGDDGGDPDAECVVPEAGTDGAPNTGLEPTVGCNPLPTGITGCSDLIALLQPKYACYLVCANDGHQLLVYCPSP